MARTVLPIVGAVVGGYFGGVAGAQAGWAVGAAIGGVVDPVVNQGPKLGDLPAQTSAEGAARAIIFGTVSVYGNVICTGPVIKSEETNSEGKGGPVNQTEAAYRSYAIRICEGPIGGFSRVWANDKLVCDIRPESLMLAESAKWLANKNFFFGDEAQLPSTFLSLQVNVDTPAYRGSAYMVAGLDNVTDTRGAIQQHRFEVFSAGQGAQILQPLIINPWIDKGDGPEHDEGSSEFRLTDGTWTASLSDAVNEAATRAAATSGDATANFSKSYIGYKTPGLNDVISEFPGGADFSVSPEVVAYQLAAVGKYNVVFDDRYATSGATACATLQLVGALPDDSKYYYTGDNLGAAGYVSNFVFQSRTATPGAGEPFRNLNNCSMSVGGGGSVSYHPVGNWIASLEARRLPSPPVDSTKVVGTAKQLAAVEYRDGVLYQNGVGPVLLPGDPDYSNATFWADARTAALAGGKIKSDVSSPVVVAAYATGYSVATGDPVPLSVIVDSVCDRAKFPSDSKDTTELDDLVGGFFLAGDYDAAAAINVLRGPYFFDATQYDGKIWFPKRGKPVVAALIFDDLVDEPEHQKREQALEFPKKLHLFYEHAASGYARVKATSQRSSSDVRVVGESSIQVPVVLDENEAAKIVAKMHKIAWAEGEGEVTFSLPDSFLRFVPSDCVQLNLRGRSQRLRIEKIDNAAGVLTFKTKHDRQTAYVSDATGVPIPPPTLPPSTIVGDTEFSYLDIPARIDSEDDLNYLVAGSSSAPGWYGWALQRSLDGGANYVTVDTYGRAAIMGELLESVPSASEWYTDTTNSVRVHLYRSGQTIDALTDAQFLSEGGGFALEKSDGSYEVMQYRDVTDEGGGIFKLSTLHRGQLNSIPANHSVGAQLVMLDRAEHVAAQSAWIGQPVTHRAPSLGQSPELADEQTNTYLGRSQIEWPVAYLTLARDGSDVITATWTPRHRFGTDVNPVASINFHGYRVTLNDGTGPIVIDTASPSITYDASALADPVSVSVASLNRITGPGPATTGSI